MALLLSMICIRSEQESIVSFGYFNKFILGWWAEQPAAAWNHIIWCLMLLWCTPQPVPQPQQEVIGTCRPLLFSFWSFDRLVGGKIYCPATVKVAVDARKSSRARISRWMYCIVSGVVSMPKFVPTSRELNYLCMNCRWNESNLPLCSCSFMHGAFSWWSTVFVKDAVYFLQIFLTIQAAKNKNGPTIGLKIP